MEDIKTAEELKTYLLQNCYNLNNYSIGGNSITEGFGLEKNGQLFSWFYTERGHTETIKYFRDEEEAVAYVISVISNDKYSKYHRICLTENVAVKDKTIKELEQKGIKYWIDIAPQGHTAISIYIEGCDIKKWKK